MEVISDLGPASPDAAAVTIGAFDGVHRGHQALLRLVGERARERGLSTVVVTFDRHPAQLVRPESAPKLLTSLDQKLELLDATGLVDRVLVLRFDDERRRESAEAFVGDVLVGRLGARLVVVGADFHFGHGRRGNVALLEAMGARLGFAVIGFSLRGAPPKGRDLIADPAAGGVIWSSTLARQLVEDGAVEAAAEVLGRPHELRGVVETGDRLGRQLGFPTANVAVPDEMCMPAVGIYAGTLRVAGSGLDRPAAISFGYRPTVVDGAVSPVLEAHVLDFAGDLYGAAVAVRFQARIRGEERFASIDALTAAIGRDVAATRAVLRGGGGAAPPPGSGRVLW